MLTHRQVWSAIDALAARYGLTPSSLAKKAGLDPTTFNKSKRATKDGRERWPSTESLAKALTAVGADIDELTALLAEGDRLSDGRFTQPIPLLGFAQAGKGGFFDDGGFPAGSGWDEIRFPSVRDDNAYALEVTGESMSPLYRAGDVLIISPNAEVRRGDRVVVRCKSGEVMAKILERRTAKTIELSSVNTDHDKIILDMVDVDWVARIIWASQ